jgi:hypothetical protein
VRLVESFLSGSKTLLAITTSSRDDEDGAGGMSTQKGVKPPKVLAATTLPSTNTRQKIEQASKCRRAG